MSRWWSAYAVGVRVNMNAVRVDSQQAFFWGDTEEQAKAYAVLKLTEVAPETGNIKSFAAPCPDGPGA